MAGKLKRIYKVIRTILVTAILLALVLPAALYIVLSLPSVQRSIKGVAESELSRLLDVDVTIGDLDYMPFNRLALKDVEVVSRHSGDPDTIALIHRLGAGVNLYRLITHGDIVVNYVELIGLDGRINKASPDAPLNIQPIITALSPKDPNKPPTLFDLKIATVVIRRSKLSYDILSAPMPEPGRFSPDRVALTDLRADIALPRLKNDDFTIDIMGLAATERSGLHLKRFRAQTHITDTRLTIVNPLIELGNSVVRPANMEIAYSSLKNIGHDLKTARWDFSLLPGTKVVGADLAPLVPALSDLTTPVDITAHIEGPADAMKIHSLDMQTPDRHVNLTLAGEIDGLVSKQINAVVRELNLNCNAPRALEIASRFVAVSPKVSEIINRTGDVSVNGSGFWRDQEASFGGKVATGLGQVDVDASMNNTGASRRVEAKVTTPDLNLGGLLADDNFGTVSLDAAFSAAIASKGKIEQGSFEGSVSRFDFRGHSFTDITANLDFDGRIVSGAVDVDDPQMNISAEGQLALDTERPLVDLDMDIDRIDLNLLGVNSQFADYRLSLKAFARLEGKNLNSASGTLDIGNLAFVDASGVGVRIKEINIRTDNASQPQYLTIDSDVLNGRIDGTYQFTDVPVLARDMLSHVIPSLIRPIDRDKVSALPPADFSYAFTISPDDNITRTFRLPVSVVRDIEVRGSMNTAQGELTAEIDAPALIKGNMLMQNSVVNLQVSQQQHRADFFVGSTVAFKKDNISLSVGGAAFDDRIDASLAWNYNRAKRYDGNLSLTSSFSRDAAHRLNTRIDINPCEFAVADTIWNVRKSQIDICGDSIGIKGVRVDRDGQFVAIDGVASPSADSKINIELSDINIDYIFETLAIDNVMFGGDATGVFTASQVLSRNPKASTDGLSVKNLKYNHSLMGDAMIKSRWDNAAKAVKLDADISQPNGCHSYVDGRILPMADSLDFHFKADKIQVGFMKPFMAAFASEVDGYASGEARLWGSFKYIDMVGDIYAQDFKVKLDFTGTEYSCTDSVHLTPGYIAFDQVELSDRYGNHAMLNGYLRHEFFKAPRFEFNVTDADNLLVYDKPGTPEGEEIWYGRVFGYGSASVKGEPGKVDIGVNMRTADKSTFTFVLSDAEVADDYTFITFRDRGKVESEVDVKVEEKSDPIAEFMARQTHRQEDVSTVYTMDIAVDVTPQAEVILVMDPVGGDRIRAFGQGNLRLTYASDTEALRMYGDYALDRGNYNFTLQDIIIKDFSISPGSRITFNGDPYSAQLDIRAEYIVQANLSDLDESFLEDKDLNRTNVPVHAVMLISGDMRQPDIKFDLAFPTLNSDIDRKVRSIISTDDMMSRQIVYLLTLSRFYTPDYMTATRGNELVSMASSTLSSQLSSMLGQISDNWSIAPSVRSDKGDFTDVEVDLALSSSLLNNRLLLNGNFGYRDNALNSNSFIGDFDVEYLLNRTGTIRLKAYNRYNEQNYYLRSALTTQGVGVAFRKDFDSFGDFFRFLRRKKNVSAEQENTNDTIPVAADKSETPVSTN